MNHPSVVRTIQVLGVALAVLCGRTVAARPDAPSRPGVEAGPLSFRVTIDKSVRAEPATGRLVVYLIKAGAMVGFGAEPGDAPFFENPQPCFGVDVKSLAPGQPATLDDGATSFPAPMSKLPKGTYRAQAVLDMNRLNSDWHKEPGNLYSPVVTFEANPDGSHAGTVELRLTKATAAPKLPSVPGCEIFEFRSPMLSEFHHRDVVLRAGVVFPTEHKDGQVYPAVYEVPGYGGDAGMAFGAARGRAAGRGDPAANELWKHAFYIVLDAESGNGHTLWADSDNNGPCARALVEEFIPALEKRYNLLAKPEARFITGHSSGGWSSLWLQVTHPETFGGAWPSSPDPVDFRRFQKTDIYSHASMYSSEGTQDDTASYRGMTGATRMTVRTENAVEEVIGPDNTSGQQWDSWQAVFGPRAASGNPAALYDPASGTIDRAVAEKFRRYDIGELIRRDPAGLAPIFRDRVRLIVGDKDSFFLNEAVALLKQDVDKAVEAAPAVNPAGYIKVLPGDHGSVMMTPESRARLAEMLEQFRRSGVVAP